MKNLNNSVTVVANFVEGGNLGEFNYVIKDGVDLFDAENGAEYRVVPDPEVNFNSDGLFRNGYLILNNTQIGVIQHQGVCSEGSAGDPSYRIHLFVDDCERSVLFPAGWSSRVSVINALFGTKCVKFGDGIAIDYQQALQLIFDCYSGLVYLGVRCFNDEVSLEIAPYDKRSECVDKFDDDVYVVMNTNSSTFVESACAFFHKHVQIHGLEDISSPLGLYEYVNQESTSPDERLVVTVSLPTVYGEPDIDEPEGESRDTGDGLPF